MEDRGRWTCEYWKLVLALSLVVSSANGVLAQVRYSISEEVKHGTPVGNIAKDLGLDISKLGERRFRIVSGSKESVFGLYQNNGTLYVSGNMDREEICDGNAVCLINLKVVAENPLEIHHVGVEIIDVNDHSPTFPAAEKRMEISESTLPGAHFQLPAASDPDSAVNSVRFYKLSPNDHFELEIKDRGEDIKIPFLLLKKHLDREQTDVHNLLLTAVDGGSPPRTGELSITVAVLDTNDNRPYFDQDIYSATLPENTEAGTVVLKVKATDPDEGTNGHIEYSFGSNLKRKVYETFHLDGVSGEIRVKGQVDFEDTEVYQLDIKASDKGQPPMTVDCSVFIKIQDVNDNKPEIEVTSLTTSVAEDSKPGTVIALVSVTDLDSDMNGKTVSSIPNNLPFELKMSFQDNLYSLVTKGNLDRELVSHYNVTIEATDSGQPPLSTFKTVSVQISDVNDNSPEFLKNPYEFYLLENNNPGVSIFSVLASDKDLNENAVVSYHLLKHAQKQKEMSYFFNINPDDGNIYALKSFDFEREKSFQFQVVAKDAGSPSLSSNVTVKVFILDQNDNAPVILSPGSANGSAEFVQEIPRNANAGHLVTKVRAYDPDIGYNGWLSFSLQHVSDPTLFGLERYTGHIRTLRTLMETDRAEHKLLVLVKDNGNVSLSATATVLVKLVETKEASAATDLRKSVKSEDENNLTFYLIVSLGSVSALFAISIVGLIVIQCCKPEDYPSKYAHESSYVDTGGNGTLCHSIQYRSGEKRYMLVGPRTSIGSTLVPGSNRNTLVIGDSRTQSSTEVSTCKIDISFTCSVLLL